MRIETVVLAIVALAAAASACGGGSDGARPGETPPGPRDPALLRGTLSLDGAPFDAEFLGARVLMDGLITPCQVTIPGVFSGVYEIGVAADAEIAGCGAPGSEIVLWTVVDEEWFHSLESAAWPGNGETVTFDATFSSAMPEGIAPRTTDIAGEAFTNDGISLPVGARVEAYVGEVLCGVASLRAGSGAEVTSTGFSIAVVGSETVAGCDEGATITFRVDGAAAVETADHDFEGTHITLTMP